MARYHASMSHEVTRLLNEVRSMDAEMLLIEHGIRIHADGTVTDTVMEKRHQSLNDWANETVEEDFCDTFESFHHESSYDDEY